MELRDYWDAIRSGWRIVLAALLLSLAVGVTLTLVEAPRYTAVTELFVAARTDSQDPEELYERNQVAAARMASYAEVVGGDAMAAQVAEAVGVDRIPTDTVEVTAVPGTVVMTIAATSTSARRAQEIAAAYADLAPAFIDDLEAVEGDDDAAQVRLRVIDVADVPDEPSSPDPVRNIVLSVLIGLGAGLGAAVVVRVIRREFSRESSGDAG